MVKFYCYLLYKVRRFRRLIHIKGMSQRGEITMDAAGLMMALTIGWSVLVLSFAMRGLVHAGLVPNKMAQQFWFFVVIGLQWATVWWGNYRLFKSKRWQAHAAEFEAYSNAKHAFGSLLASFALLTIAISPLVLLRYFPLELVTYALAGSLSADGWMTYEFK